jgi:hypothetical protein
LELDADHRGAKCRCECPSCGKPLTAVNAAKAEFMRRPHFRHPEGAQRADCLVLAARAAALRQLQREGWIQLPRRRVSARVAGLSGEFHEAWVEQPAERLRIDQVDYRDRAIALVTFDDGRTLFVDLTGTPGRPRVGESSSGGAPTIYLAIDDPSLAGLDPAELLRRATLLPNEECWQTHWNDAALLQNAERAARAKAHFYFDDAPGELEIPEGLDPALRRETVLHHEVKRILEEVGRVTVPAVAIEEEVPGLDGRPLKGQWIEDEEELLLRDIELETSYGQLIPDITCNAFADDDDGHARYRPLLIEVTVTNALDEERCARIRAAGEATLEIDLSLAGGRVNRDELQRLVVDEVATKRWVYRQDLDWQREQLRERLLKQVARQREDDAARLRWLEERRLQVLATPIGQIVDEYLGSVTRMLDATDDPAAVRAAREEVSDAASQLALHGYPEAADDQLVGPGGILAHVLSIRLGRAVGRRSYRVAQLLRVLQRTGVRRANLTVYFIAARAYPLELLDEERAWLDAWAGEVRRSIQAGDAAYLRDPFYDRFLSLVFPEMASGLSKPFGKAATPAAGVRWDASREIFVRPDVAERKPARFLALQPRTDGSQTRLLDTRPGQLWLQGRDLEAWKRAHPEAARDWFPDDAPDS